MNSFFKRIKSYFELHMHKIQVEVRLQIYCDENVVGSNILNFLILDRT